jgi:NADH:ubiquinone oxidoreductase subunit 4 (subunit M)
MNRRSQFLHPDARDLHVPLVGGLLLLVFPRRDRDIRIFALVISLLTFVLSLHLPFISIAPMRFSISDR